MDTTSELFANTLHKLKFSCAVSYIEEEQLNPDTIEPFCYNLEVHDSFGDGLCCDNGPGYFSISIDNTKNETLEISNPFYEGNKIEMSFCINDKGNIESDTWYDVNQPSYYPLKTIQCKNKNTCVCDSKPNIFTDVEKSDVLYEIKSQTLFGISMLSQSNKLQDIESPHYKAACWVLFDDPYRYISTRPEEGTQKRKLQQYSVYVEEGAQKRMMQRYALAVLYFSTTPKKWQRQYKFLSRLSECEWNKESNEDGVFSIQGSVCDNNGNIISVYLSNNNLDGTIVEEFIGLRMLETLNLPENKIFGEIPSMFGRLSNLRSLDLGRNDLEGTLPPQLFNARNLEDLSLNLNRIEGTIPGAIGNLRKLTAVQFGGNNLSGSIPDAIYTSLKNLRYLYLDHNKLSSTISTLIGSLNRLTELDLSNNMLSGQIPTSLYDLYVGKVSLQNNAITGHIPDDFCHAALVKADCRNDIFEPQVSCSCCTCTDVSPTWDGECADATIKVEIDRRPVYNSGEFVINSDALEWSITNVATQKKIPLNTQDGMGGGTACVAFSECISIDMISPPIFNTYFQVYWNNDSFDDGVRMFPGSLEQQGSTLEYNNDPFQFDEENQKLVSCRDIELTCNEGNKKKKYTVDPSSEMHMLFSKVVSLFGRQDILEPSSPQSKAFCRMLQNDDYLNKSEIEILQRYVLSILHFMTPYGLFSGEKYSFNKHECEWNGITCKQNNETKVVTGISLSSEHNNIINGTLIDELGSLKHLELLELNQTQLYGTIPQSYSNLWSLVKLDLSGNKLSGTIPKTLFHQLNHLEHIDLSDNSLSGSINEDIGSLSHVHSIFLSKNLFTGSLPLDRFKYTDLKHLDVSRNELVGLDFPRILDHKNLKTLDLSSNFFKGSIPDYTFISLIELESFNISKNDFSDTLPSTYTELSNITHFDVHANRLQGTIPHGMSALSKAQHINLQGNKLTGSLPSELNQLKNINTLVLSHNELKGFIPFDPKTLQNIDRLHLQNNKLSGQAPIFSNLTSYITDCGFPSDSLDPVSCTSCNTCCNSDGACQSKISEKVSQVHASLIFMFTIMLFIMICYALKDNITSNRYLESFFVNTVSYWNALMLISDKSVYHFLLLENKICWYVAFLCGIFQSLTLFLFVHSADIVNETSDREYTMLCPANSLECEDSNKISSYGIFIFSLILTIWLLRDIVGSVKLMLVSFQKRDVDFFFTSGFVFSVTMLSLWCSIIYIQAIAVKNTDMIKDAVVLLFVVEIDERLFQLIESLNPDWVQKVDRNMRNSLVYEGKDLVISSWMNKYSASFRSMRIGMRQSNESPSVKQQHDMNEEVEGIVEKEEKDQVEAVNESSP